MVRIPELLTQERQTIITNSAEPFLQSSERCYRARKNPSLQWNSPVKCFSWNSWFLRSPSTCKMGDKKHLYQRKLFLKHAVLFYVVRGRRWRGCASYKGGRFSLETPRSIPSERCFLQLFPPDYTHRLYLYTQECGTDQCFVRMPSVSCGKLRSSSAWRAWGINSGQWEPDFMDRFSCTCNFTLSVHPSSDNCIITHQLELVSTAAGKWKHHP